MPDVENLINEPIEPGQDIQMISEPTGAGCVTKGLSVTFWFRGR